MKTAFIGLLLFLSVAAYGQNRVCPHPKTGQLAVVTDPNAACSVEIKQYAFLCDTVIGAPECTQPATYNHPAASALAQGATAAGEYTEKGYTYWRWSKNDQILFVTPRYFVLNP